MRNAAHFPRRARIAACPSRQFLQAGFPPILLRKSAKWRYVAREMRFGVAACGGACSAAVADCRFPGNRPRCRDSGLSVRASQQISPQRRDRRADWLRRPPGPPPQNDGAAAQPPGEISPRARLLGRNERKWAWPSKVACGAAAHLAWQRAGELAGAAITNVARGMLRLSCEQIPPPVSRGKSAAYFVNEICCLFREQSAKSAAFFVNTLYTVTSTRNMSLILFETGDILKFP
jgi:hypothetical protein